MYEGKSNLMKAKAVVASVKMNVQPFKGKDGAACKSMYLFPFY